MTTRYDSIGAGSQRLRFKEFQFERTPDGHCRARVVLAWSDGREFVGEADGMGSQAGDLRCAAVATVRAIVQATGNRAEIELLGVKAVRGFDSTVVIVSLGAQDATRSVRLVGSYLAESEPARGAALAVMNATNRIMGNYFLTR